MSGTRGGPVRLDRYVDGYRAWLLARGYTPSTVRMQLMLLRRLDRWMAGEGLDARELDGGVVDVFLAAWRATGRSRMPGSFVSLLGHLREEGVIAPEDPGLVTPLDELIERYRECLVGEWGLATTTVRRYVMLARRFLAGRGSPGDGLGVRHLTGVEVSGFLLEECGRLSVGAAKARVAELRSLLRFLYLRGLTALALADAVPSVAGWRDVDVPQTIAAADIDRLLLSCERSEHLGARDFAVLMLLARLGLRSVEVARLELDDVDWRAGEIMVRGKARRFDRLPLPGDVGEALAGYLSFRGGGEAQRVFLTLRAPTRPIRPELVGDIVERACKRAGVAHVGAHRLRHALASELLRQGASMIDISQVLRHTDLASTAIYAKVDLGRLREVAQPWPVGVNR